MSITFRTWVSRRFFSATTHDLGQEPVNFSKIVMWFIVAQSFPVSALLWPGPGQFWQVIVGKQCTRVEGRAASSVCSPGDNPFVSAPSLSQGGASYLRTPVGAVTLCCCSSVLSSSSYCVPVGYFLVLAEHWEIMISTQGLILRTEWDPAYTPSTGCFPHSELSE